MQTKLALTGLALTLACAPATAAAAKPTIPPPTNAAITIEAKPAITIFSGTSTLSGRVSGAKAGALVRLEQDDTRPYGDSYKPAAGTATVAANGKYTFTVKPLLNTQYRAVAQASPPVTSAGTLVRVRILVGSKLSDSTPRRGSLVRFSGTVFPAHDGRTVSIQRRTPSGSFVTVARTTLRDAGATSSKYSRRVRVSRDGVYRVKVTGDGDHLSGYSRLRAVTVHG